MPSLTAMPRAYGPTPYAGPTNAATKVTITGQNLGPVTSVSFGTMTGTVLTASTTRIEVTAPPQPAGDVNVSLLTADGPISAGIFTYVAPPTLVSVTPNRGGMGGIDRVRLTGSNLCIRGEVSIMFGHARVSGRDSQVCAADRQSVLVTPPRYSSAGPVTITVQTPGGTATAAYTFIDAPQISSVIPNLGPASGGTRVTIRGTNLLESIVSVGPYRGIIESNTSDTVVFTTPPALQGDWGRALAVTASTPGGSTYWQNFTFTYRDGASSNPAPGTPAISSISPPSGPESGGTTVTILGSNLAGATEVLFGTVRATITASNTSSVTVKAPAGTGNVAIAVVTPAGRALTPSRAYAYVRATPNPPTITALSASAGPAVGGNTITITGANLAGATSVTFGGVPATITAATSTSITVSLPPCPGPVDVVVTTPAGSVTLARGYTGVPAPTVTALSRTTGPAAGGNTITITGTNLASAIRVLFGGAKAVITATTATTVTVTVPPGSGTVGVTVETSGGSVTQPGGYAYGSNTSTLPTISGVTPSAGAANCRNTIKVSGTNLAETTEIRIGASVATIIAATSTTVTAITPPGTGTVDVSVTTPNGSTTRSRAYVYGTSGASATKPSITSINPPYGGFWGGYEVEITGTNLDRVSSVTFGNLVSTQIGRQTSSSLRVVVPESPTVGQVPVTVNAGTGCATKQQAFTYNSPVM